METETRLSSLFHKYINYMMTTDDRLLFTTPDFNYEVCGYWRDKQTRDLMIDLTGEDMTSETANALLSHWSNRMTDDLPIIVFRYTGWVVIWYCTQNRQPHMTTAVATEDWCAIVEEAARLGLYVKVESSAKVKVVPFKRQEK